MWALGLSWSAATRYNLKSQHDVCFNAQRPAVAFSFDHRIELYIGPFATSKFDAAVKLESSSNSPVCNGIVPEHCEECVAGTGSDAAKVPGDCDARAEEHMSWQDALTIAVDRNATDRSCPAAFAVPVFHTASDSTGPVRIFAV